MSQSILWRERGRKITCQMKLSAEPSISGCKAGEQKWGRWCLLLIQNKHTLPLTNGSILDNCRKNSSLCVFVCRRRLRLLTLQFKDTVPCLTRAKMWCSKTREEIHTGSSNCLESGQTQDPFCTFYLQNVLKVSVQRLTNEVQQIMHASLALLYYYAWRFLLFAEGEVKNE